MVKISKILFFFSTLSLFVFFQNCSGSLESAERSSSTGGSSLPVRLDTPSASCEQAWNSRLDPLVVGRVTTHKFEYKGKILGEDIIPQTSSLLISEVISKTNESYTIRDGWQMLDARGVPIGSVDIQDRTETKEEFIKICRSLSNIDLEIMTQTLGIITGPSEKRSIEVEAGNFICDYSHVTIDHLGMPTTFESWIASEGPLRGNIILMVTRNLADDNLIATETRKSLVSVN
jgi:hypothetical protein